MRAALLRAAEVLEQERIVEVPAFLFGEADVAADVHPDPAAADTVSGRLAFDEIQRVAQRAEQPGKPNFLPLRHGPAP